MAQGMSDIDIANWLKQEGSYISRITLGKHKREHLTTEHETARIAAAQILKKQQGTIKFKGDLASLVRDQVSNLVEAGHLTPTLSEGLRAQEIIDRRQEKSSDRELTMALAGILGGSTVVEGTAVDLALDSSGEGTEDVPVQTSDFLVDDNSGLRGMAQESEDGFKGSAQAQDSGILY
jgi:hypothetical protein